VEDPQPLELPPLLFFAVLGGFVLALLLAIFGLGGVPHVTDEVAYTLQSRLFAGGMRVGPAADNASMLVYPFWVTSPVSYAAFPMGWPLLLAVGERLGLPWMINPLLHLVASLLVWGLAREWLKEEEAVVAGAIAALSPGVVLLGATRMSQTSVLVAMGVVALVLVRRRDKAWAFWAAGAAVAYLVLARPFEALWFGLPCLVYGVVRASCLSRRVGLVLLPLLAALVVARDNLALTGSALVFPIGPFFDSWVADLGRPPGCNQLGFGPDIGCAPTLGSFGHDLGKALQLALASLLRLDRLLLGLPGGSLLVVGGACLLKRRGALLLGLVLVNVLVYLPYWSPGAAYGARFYHPSTLVLPLLLASALVRVCGRYALAVVVALCLLGVRPLFSGITDYWCVDSGLRRALSEAEIDAGVLFVRGGEPHQEAWPALGNEALACDPMLDSGSVYQLLDPTRQSGGWQPRHALGDFESTRRYLDQLHPEAEGYVVSQREGSWDIARVPVAAQEPSPSP
jgi:hypothetical protein